VKLETQRPIGRLIWMPPRRNMLPATGQKRTEPDFACHRLLPYDLQVIESKNFPDLASIPFALERCCADEKKPTLSIILI